MRSLAMSMAMLTWLAAAACAEVAPWGTSALSNQAADAVPIRLGRPVPIAGPQDDASSNPEQSVPISHASPIIRCQSPAPPPPPPPPSGGVPPFPGSLPGGEEAYNCGVVAKESHGIFGGFFSRVWDDTKKWCEDVPSSLAGAFQPGAGRAIFQSDHKFDSFTSPLTNPFFFEDPRALTEF